MRVQARQERRLVSAPDDESPLKPRDFAPGSSREWIRRKGGIESYGLEISSGSDRFEIPRPIEPGSPGEFGESAQISRSAEQPNGPGG